MGVQLQLVQLLVIRHLCHLCINHMHLINGFFLAVFLLFVKPMGHMFDFFHIKQIVKNFLASICTNKKLDLVSYNSESNHARKIFLSLNCTPLSPITITYPVY